MHENKFSISLKKAAAASLCLGLLWGLPLETVQARVKEQRAEAVSYTMEYPEVKVPNSRAEKAINEDILRYVSDFQKAYQAGKFYQGDFSYKVRYEDDNVVSLTLADYRYHIGAAPWLHPYPGAYLPQDGWEETAPVPFCEAGPG